MSESAQFLAVVFGFWGVLVSGFCIGYLVGRHTDLDPITDLLRDWNDKHDS